MTTARQAAHSSEESFVTLNLLGPVAELQRELIRQGEAMPAVFAVQEAAPGLKRFGLRHLSISVGRSGGLVLECAVPADLEYEHEPTRAMSVTLRRAANEAGGWVETVDFVPAHAE